jgi:hypothetical protein
MHCPDQARIAAEFLIEGAGLAKVRRAWPVISRVGEPTQTRFFIDERAARHGITLTDHLLELANGLQAQVLPLKVDARWNLVQTSWGPGLGTRLVSFEIAPDQDAVDLHRHRHEQGGRRSRAAARPHVARMA